MKKMGLSIVSVLLIVCLSFSLVGCSDNSKFVGKWKSDLDISALIEEQLNKSESTKDFTQYFDMSKLEKIGLIFEFKSNGTYKISLDKDSLDTFTESLRIVMKSAMSGIIESTIKSQGYNMTIDEFTAASGISLDQLVDEAMQEFDPNDLLDKSEEEGKFEAKDGKLYTTDSLDAKINSKLYDTYEISGSEFKLIKHYGDDANDFTKLYPLTFVKQ